MGLGIAAVQNTLEIWQQGYLENVKKVVEMGSQELHLAEADFDELIAIAGVKNYEKDKFPNLGNWPESPRCSSKHLYRILGIDDYYSLDLNEKLGSMSHDYNLPLEDTSLYSQFDLVTDHGACEHAFNIAETYRTMHRMCKPGGLIIIDQALWGGNGYYLFDRPFFDGIAAANNYKVLFTSYIICPGKKTEHGSDFQFHIPMNKDLLNTIASNVPYIGVYALIQKQVEADFQFPYQGDYLVEKQQHLGFNRLFYRDPPSYSYISLANPEGDGISIKFILRMLIHKVKHKVSSIFSR